MTEKERKGSEPPADIDIDGDTPRKDKTVEIKGGALKAYVKLLVESEDDDEANETTEKEHHDSDTED